MPCANMQMCKCAILLLCYELRRFSTSRLHDCMNAEPQNCITAELLLTCPSSLVSCPFFIIFASENYSN